MSDDYHSENVIDRARSRFDEVASATQDERMMALEDRRFVFIQGAQWEGDWGDQFENGLRVQINKVQRGHDKIINDYRANRFMVEFRPEGASANDDTASLLNKLMWADMYRSKGHQALDNCFGEGVAGGMGAFRLMNEYEDEYDPDNDHQRIAIMQIPDADQRVFFDLDAKLYDKSDARFAYVLHSMTVPGFKAEYGERATSWPEGRARSNWFDWFRPSVVFIAEYYEVEEAKEALFVYEFPLTGETERYWESSITEEMRADLKTVGWRVKSKRQIKRKRVHKYIMSGAEVLEDCGFIAGECIPIIPFYGKRVFVDNVERFKGHVRDAKDPARLYNAQVSSLAEVAALSPREVPIFAPEQMEGLRDNWANMNIERHPYAEAHPIIDPVTGSIVQTGPIGKIEAPQVAPATAALIQITGADIAEITNGDDGSMEIKSNVSGEAMDIAASRVDAKSYIYMDNFQQTMQRFGEVYISMAREVYVEEGREVQTMDEEGQPGTATLHETYTDPVTKATGKRHDLSVGKYNVCATVTEATATRRDKTVRTMGSIAQTAGAFGAMDLANAALLTSIMNMDGEGVNDLKTWARKQALSMGLVEPTQQEKEEAAEAQKNAAPDPQAMAIEAQAKALAAQADKFAADTGLSEAKTAQTKAAVIETLAKAQKLVNEAGQVEQQPLPEPEPRPLPMGRPVGIAA